MPDQGELTPAKRAEADISGWAAESGRPSAARLCHRVARALGRPEHIPPPRKYLQLGRYAERTAIRRVAPPEDQTWHGVARSVGLRPNRSRNGAAAEDARRVA